MTAPNTDVDRNLNVHASSDRTGDAGDGLDGQAGGAVARASLGDDRGFAHCQKLRVRYAETDAMGVVYHANYITYFEVARVEYLRAAGIDYRSLEDQKMTGAVVEVGVRYHAPARFDDELSLCTRCPSMGKVRFRMEYEIWREADRTLIVSGHTEHALLAHATLRPVRIPDEIRAGIMRFEGERAAVCGVVPSGNGRVR